MRLANSKEDYNDAGMDSSDINNIQNKIESLRLKNKNDISILENKITESQFYEIPEWFSSIDSRSYEGELINFIYELIENGIDDREEIMLELTNQLEFLSITEGENVGGEFYLELYDNREKVYKYIDYTLKILDLANNPEDIKKAFERYFKTTILSGETDANKLNDLIDEMEPLQVYTQQQVDTFVDLYLNNAEREKLDPILDTCVENYKELEVEEQILFKSSAKTKKGV